MGSEARQFIVDAAAEGATITLDYAGMDGYAITLTQNTAFIFINHIAGKQTFMVITQAALAKVVTWDPAILWPQGFNPDLTSAGSSGVSIVQIYDDGVNWHASLFNGDWLGKARVYDLWNVLNSHNYKSQSLLSYPNLIDIPANTLAAGDFIDLFWSGTITDNAGSPDGELLIQLASQTVVDWLTQTGSVFPMVMGQLYYIDISGRISMQTGGVGGTYMWAFKVTLTDPLAGLSCTFNFTGTGNTFDTTISNPIIAEFDMTGHADVDLILNAGSIVIHKSP